MHFPYTNIDYVTVFCFILKQSKFEWHLFSPEKRANWPSYYPHLWAEIETEAVLSQCVSHIIKKSTHSFTIKPSSVSSGKQSVVFVKLCLVPKEPSRNERYLSFLVAELTVFLVQHRGDKAQRQVNLKQFWELQVINNLKYWLFSPLVCFISALLVRICFYRHLKFKSICEIHYGLPLGLLL